MKIVLFNHMLSCMLISMGLLAAIPVESFKRLIKNGIHNKKCIPSFCTFVDLYLPSASATFCSSSNGSLLLITE